MTTRCTLNKIQKQRVAPAQHAFYWHTANQNELARTVTRGTTGASWKNRGAGERAVRYCGRKDGTNSLDDELGSDVGL